MGVYLNKMESRKITVFHLQICIDGSWDPHEPNRMGTSPLSMGLTGKSNGSQLAGKIADVYHLTVILLYTMVPLLRNPLLIEFIF